MAAPRFSPVAPIDSSRGYSSPDVVPPTWMADRPGDLDGPQPMGDRLGWQGPDQGYALKLVELVRPDVIVQPGESVDDALVGIVATALRRASLFGRAPVIHDLRVAQRIWGFADAAPSASLVAARTHLFDGLALGHAYEQTRALVDAVPEASLRATPATAPVLTL
jgi:hypothetical protein